MSDKHGVVGILGIVSKSWMLAGWAKLKTWWGIKILYYRGYYTKFLDQCAMIYLLIRFIICTLLNVKGLWKFPSTIIGKLWCIICSQWMQIIITGMVSFDISGAYRSGPMYLNSMICQILRIVCSPRYWFMFWTPKYYFQYQLRAFCEMSGMEGIQIIFCNFDDFILLGSIFHKWTIKTIADISIHLWLIF